MAGTQGRLGEAREHLRAAEGKAVRQKLPAMTGRARTLATELPLALMGDSAATLRGIDAMLAAPEFAQLGARQRAYRWMAEVLASAGRPDEAESLLEEARRQHAADGVVWNESDGVLARAIIERVRGREDRALEALRRVEELGRFSGQVDLERARVHEQAGRPDSALAAYERVLASTGFDRLPLDLLHLGFVLQRTGELHDERGDRARALEYYARFVELWQDADPELQPRVESVRRRMAALMGEG